MLMSKELNIEGVKKNWIKDIDINSKYLEHIKSYKYLVSIVNGDNSFEEEITERIALGSKSYYVNQKNV